MWDCFMRLKLFAVVIASIALSWLPARAEAPQTIPQFPFCSWWAETTATSVNVAFPDSDAAYWTTPIPFTPDLQSVTIAGTFTDARYFSLNGYNNGGASYTCAGAQSALTDFQIMPDAGSQNPFRTDAPAGGAFTVTMSHVGAGTLPSNTLPLYEPGDPTKCAPAPKDGALPASLGFLIYRTYLPHSGFDQVKLPTLTLHYTNGSSAVLPQCKNTMPAEATANIPSSLQILAQLLARDATSSGSAEVTPCGRPGAQSCPPDLTFFRPLDGSTGGFFPNVDNKYIAALVSPKPDTLVVIHGQAATFPAGDQATVWQPDQKQLRYWSLCSNVYRRPFPVVVVKDGDQTIVGCTADLNTPLDTNGYYTYVVSSLDIRPSASVLSANSATWLPLSSTQPYARHLMILRNMLGNDFAHSVQNCQDGSTADAIAACKSSMAGYYPQIAECSPQTFANGGTAACLAEQDNAD
jgi:hypothetical protein